jgi:membrane associated rhomboid family serine protease
VEQSDAAREDDELAALAQGANIRTATSRERLEEWALVLAAVGIPHRVAHTVEGGFALGVAIADVPRADRALATYEAESRAAARPTPAAPDRGSNALGIVVGLGLAAFVFKTGYWESDAGSRWFAAGVANAQKLRAGEWWRAVTAMTLHADVMHLLGNILASLIFMGAAGRWLGGGVAAMLILLAGTAANLLTAWFGEREHFSVGASTATFAALGLVVGLQVVRRWRGGGFVRRRAWVAAGAGLALLAMLGMGARADVFAHAFGLGMGTLLGVAAGCVDRPAADAHANRRKKIASWLANGLLAIAAFGALVGAWAIALARG